MKDTKKGNTPVTSIRIPSDIMGQIRKRAALKGISVSELIKELIRKQLSA